MARERERVRALGVELVGAGEAVLKPALSIPVRVVDEQGELWKDWRVTVKSWPMTVAVTREALGPGLFGLEQGSAAPLDGGDFVRAGAESGVPEGALGLIRLKVEPPVHASLVLQDAILATRRIDGPLDELVFVLDRARIEEHLGGLKARFVDALSGQPIANGSASLDPPATLTVGGQLLDGAEAAFTGCAPGRYHLCFYHDDYEKLDRAVRVPEGRVEDLGHVPVWCSSWSGRPITPGSALPSMRAAEA